MSGAAKALVMVVDDEADIRSMMVMALELGGYRAVAANDGARALDLLRRGERPAMVLLDLMMPRMDGREFLRRLRADDVLGGIPVVVVTGHSAEQRASELDVQGLLKKPVSMRHLLAAVAQHCPNEGE